jgi:hypothetical protein
MNINNINNIKILDNYLNKNNNVVEYSGISNNDDFSNYESIIRFKYKITNTKHQLSKICDFITEYNKELHYDWYIKFRPDIRLLEEINFEKLAQSSINARARVYNGPLKLEYGLSVGGNGFWRDTIESYYNERETEVILDDMIYIFDHNVVMKNGFEKFEFDSNILIKNGFEKFQCGSNENEWVHTSIWKCRNINLNVIGINMENTKYNAYSGNINM